MSSRRSFVKTVGAGAAWASVAPFAVEKIIVSPALSPMRIGIIGAENSHTIGFGKMFNIDKKFPEVSLTHVWGETDTFAQKAAEGGHIPNIVKDPSEMLGKIDALIVDHRHAQYHLAAATPFVKAGIPTFIDKPFCYRVEEGKAFLELARAHKTPVTSFSTVAHTAATYDIKQQVSEMKDINHVICHGPVDLGSPYGGIFFYGIHLVQPLMFVFGDEIARVKITRDGIKGSAALVFKNGLYATLIFKNKAYGWETFVETPKALVQLKSRTEEKEPGMVYTDMIQMFRTRVEPRSHKSMLTEVAILEALERSAQNELWVDVNAID